MEEVAMTTSELVYDKEGLCAAMGCGYKRAKRILEEHGVVALDYGKGRSGGLRWLRESVTEVLHAMATKTAPQKKGRRTKHHTIEGKSVDVLFMELNSDRMPIQ